MNGDGRSSAVHLTTERLVLRRLTEADADELLALDSDPEVMRYLTGGVPHTREQITGRDLPRMLADYDRYDHFGFWAAIERVTGAFLGWFEFRPYRPCADGDRTWLSPQAHRVGKGVRDRRIARADRKGVSQTSAYGLSLPRPSPPTPVLAA